jgi:hypothetical protein
MKKIAAVGSLVGLFSLSAVSSVSASTPVYHNYHDIEIFNNAGTLGFEVTATLPPMTSNWASDANHNLNKVNFEVWQQYYYSSTKLSWLEIGFKKGRGYDSMGQPDTQNYEGLFSAKYEIDPNTGVGAVAGVEWLSEGWASGQTHTWSGKESGGANTLTVDGTSLITYSGLTTNTNRQIHAGVEFQYDTTLTPWNPLPNGNPDYMTNLKVWNGSAWHLWNEYGSTDLSTNDDNGSYCTVSWDSANNRIAFN